LLNLIWCCGDFKENAIRGVPIKAFSIMVFMKKKMWKEGIPLVTIKKFPKPYHTYFKKKKKKKKRTSWIFAYFFEYVDETA